MRIEHHLLGGCVVAAVVDWQVSVQAGLLAMAASVLIDVDHYLWYAIRFRDASLRRAARFYAAAEADKHYCVCVFHTVEAACLYALCLWMGGWPAWIAVGCLAHILLDVLQGLLDGRLMARKWSLIRGVWFWAQQRATNRPERTY
jgi:hypothetical protein